ncbi:MAG: hypothetical protein AAF998_10395 [Bacteroidota bacterium]
MKNNPIAYHFRMPVANYVIGNILFFGLFAAALYLLTTGKVSQELAWAFVISLGILMAGFLVLTILGFFVRSSNLILLEAGLQYPTLFKKGYRKIKFNDIEQILITYRSGVEPVQAKLRLKNGKTVVLPKMLFQNDEAFAECIVLLEERTNT